MFPDCWHAEFGGQQVLPQHSTPGGQQMPIPFVDRHGAVPCGHDVHVRVAGLAQVSPSGQQMPPHRLFGAQHLPLRHIDPRGQQMEPHTG